LAGKIQKAFTMITKKNTGLTLFFSFLPIIL
jgi:hypothetical protein